jgi:predicted MFS family arabinose efflux permease
MNLIFVSIAVLAAFIAIWIFAVMPAERRHHERKLEMVRKRIEQREAARAESGDTAENDTAGS